MLPRTALICGISGQDGAYLAEFLLNKGYKVIGTSRDSELNKFTNLKKLGIRDEIEVISMRTVDFSRVLNVFLKYKPDEVYNLAGQSSVALSFDHPVDTFESIELGTLNLLEVIRFLNKDIRIYNAGSSESFGDTHGRSADEQTPFQPRSPYAVAKSAAFWQTSIYREAFSLFACTGILFNHESPLRPDRFVTQKIIRAACRISRGSKEKLKLGNLEIIRDWGWAPEFIVAIWKILQGDRPRDYVIATGKSFSLQEFVELSFNEVGLNWQNYVETDESLLRPSEILISKGNPRRAQECLGWRAQYKTPDIVKLMISSELSQL